MSDTPDNEIDAGLRVAQFVSDPAVIAAFEKLDRAYWHGFKTSGTAEARDAFGQKARVLDDLQNELRTIVDNGKLATTRRDTVAARERTRR